MVLDFCLAFLNFPPFFLELYMFLVFSSVFMFQASSEEYLH